MFNLSRNNATYAAPTLEGLFLLINSVGDPSNNVSEGAMVQAKEYDSRNWNQMIGVPPGKAQTHPEENTSDPKPGTDKDVTTPAGVKVVEKDEGHSKKSHR